MVCQNYRASPVFAGHCRKETIASLSGRRFQRGLPFCSQLADITCSDLAGEIEFLGEFLYKRSICV